jgi:hypothetical protein
MLQLDLFSQRWRDGRSRFVPVRDVVNPADYDVAPLAGDTEAREFVARHHYLGSSYPAARFRYGLYTRRGDLVGVAVFAVPTSDAVLTSAFPITDPLEATVLARFVLLDEVGFCAESMMIGRLRRLLASSGIVGFVSYADPCPRDTADGRAVLRGHCGTIYAASSAVYTGRTRPSLLRLLPDGRNLNARAISKIRNGERSWLAASAPLVAHGAEAPDAGMSELERRTWLDLWLARLTRPRRHKGCHRYLFAVDKRVRRHLPAGLPYPKHPDRVDPVGVCDPDERG